MLIIFSDWNLQFGQEKSLKGDKVATKLNCLIYPSRTWINQKTWDLWTFPGPQNFYRTTLRHGWKKYADRSGDDEKETTFVQIRPLHHSQPMNFSAYPCTVACYGKTMLDQRAIFGLDIAQVWGKHGSLMRGASGLCGGCYLCALVITALFGLGWARGR